MSSRGRRPANQKRPQRALLTNMPFQPAAVLPRPYLVFLGDVTEPVFAKTAFGLRDWARDECVAEFACSEGAITLGLPKASPEEAYERGARALVIGVANLGGTIAERWLPSLLRAIEAGLHIVSGMHARLEDLPDLRAAAARHGCQLINVRLAPPHLPIATGRRRSGRRLLTVGTDCALGKKYTALALARAFVSRGIDADFRATGQTGIIISGGGIPLDAVISDFAAGAIESFTPDAAPAHWDIIEGQGSLFHPSYSGVSLSLLHGSQADVFVVCHDPCRRSIVGHPEFPLPTLEQTIDLTRTLGRRTNPNIRCAGISLNTSRLSPEDANRALREVEDRLGLPAADPMTRGRSFESLVDSCLGIDPAQKAVGEYSHR